MSIPKPLAFHHTCFLVRDLEATARSLSASLGIGPFAFFTIVPTASKVRGREQAFSFRVALATIGGGTYELVSPATGPSVYDEFLERHGDGFHHTCLTYGSIADVRAAKQALLDEGRELIQEASAGDLFEFAYFEFPELGSAVEVLYLDGAKLGAPEKVV
jgi:catechol 2,3-dioxygenase-like lactoylglutathione lyase family enzyme